MIYNRNLFLIFFSIIYIKTIYFFPISAFSYNLLDEEKIKHDLQIIRQIENTNKEQKNIIDFLESTLHYISEKKLSNKKIKEYKSIIDNFPYIALQLQDECDGIKDPCIINNNQNLSIYDIKQKLSAVNNQLRDISDQLQKEKKKIRSIQELLKLLPQQQIAIKNILNSLEQQRQIFFINPNTPLEHAKFTEFQAKQSANRLKIVELELAQLSANNRKELSKLRIILLKKKYNHTYNELQILRNQFNNLQYIQANQEILNTEEFISKQNIILPTSIAQQLQKNKDLISIFAQQTKYSNNIDLKIREIDDHILQVHQTFSDLVEQSQWVNKSPALGEILRLQVSKLPKIPKFHQLDIDIAQLRTNRLQYENRINTLPIFLSHSKQDDGSSLSPILKKILEKQLNIQRKLIALLLSYYDMQILELTKLKLSYEQLKDAIIAVQKATHRYLFWVADINPITISYLLDVYQDIYKLFTDKKFRYQITSFLYITCTNYNTLILILLYSIILLGLHFSMQYHYYEFLERSSKCIGKVNQDNFSITFYNICSSILISIPIPILWAIIGHHLSHAWPYSIIIAIGEGINSTIFILWIFILTAYLASSKGLFIVHFGWPKKRIQQVFSSNYFWSASIIILLIVILTICSNYNNREFSNTLGRLCFILLCIYLTFITNKLKRSGFPLYLNKRDSSKNIINHILWSIMLFSPSIAAIACAAGYLFSAQVLLSRLETSLFIWSVLLVVYYIIRRWMLIQRKRIAFNRAKKRSTARLQSKNYNELILHKQFTSEIEHSFSLEKDRKNLDLNTISVKSLQLIRSIIILIALLLTALLWSELYSAFSFLENITLWDVTSTIKGAENIQPITLKIFLTMIVVITITTIMVRNLPAFLELTLLQHLHLNPGTGYAITTLTKYTLMLLGGLIGLSLIGIEWVKIQWLIAALGVGLGFGLQEIFANFISGLMILFEKPIRIGDTITIHDITGNVTYINTRATIITNWDHKEVIVPNKEFITKKFTNWSLLNTITRIVLTVPIPFQIDIQKITHALIEIIQNSPLSLDKPKPEVYLISLRQGFPIFEIRTYTANIKFRIPLCHQINTGIIEYCKKNKIQLPYLPYYFYKEPNTEIIPVQEIINKI